MAVPQRAVTVTPQGATVLIVGPNDVVESRSVKVGEMQGDSWVVLSGIVPGERVVVDGTQKAQPGKPVQVSTGAAPAATTTAASGN